MRDEAKTKKQQLEELVALRARLDELDSEYSPQAGEARLRQVIDLVPHMIFAKDSNGRFLLVNRAVAEAYGTTVEELMGRGQREVHETEEELSRMLEDDRRVIESGHPKFIFEEEFTDHDGYQRVLQTTKIPYTESGSNVPAVLGVAVDVTQRRKLERVLAGEAYVLQLLTQGTPLFDVLTAIVRLIEGEYDGTLGSILLLDREGRRLGHAAAPSLDPAYVEAIDGIAIGPAVGSCGTAAYTGTAVIVEDIASDPLWANFRDLALDHGLRACWSHPILSSGGRVLGTFAMYYRERRRPNQDERALIVAAARLAGVAIELREAEKALEAEMADHRRTAELVRQREEEYRLTFENAPLGLTVVDDEGRFLRVNQAFCDIMGYSEEELLNMDFQQLSHPDDLKKSMQLHKKMKAGSPGKQRTLRKHYVRKDGEIVDATIHLVRIPQGDESPARYVAQLIDHTERVRAEEEARKHRERLAHVARVSTLGEMAASIAHEVNQPLTAIAAYAQACSRMIRAGTLHDAESLSTMERISGEAIRAGEIIHRLRALTRRRESERDSCDVNRLVRQVARLAEVDARLQGVAVNLDLADGLPQVIADGVQIQQVVLNLIRNAVEASEAANGGREGIRVRTYLTEDSEVEVAVVDYGAGICDDAEEQAFEPFFTTKATGMGMGLSIGRSIITAHGGRLWFKRNAGPGTTFGFTLPAECNG